MPVTLDWLLAQQALQLRLVAGSAEGVQVEWAHAIELLDPSPWLDGGELVLTTGLRMPRYRAEQAAYVDRLADRGAAGLAFGVGLRFEEVPRGLVDRCAEVGFPLVEIPLPTPFIAISRAIAQRLAEDRERALQRTVRAQQELTRITLREGLPGLAARLANELRARVVILDEYGTCIAGSERSESLAEQVKALDRAQQGRGLSAADGVEVQPLAGRAARRGWLAVEQRESADPADRVLINHAVSVATLHLDRPREVEDAWNRVGGSVLGLLLDRAPAHPSVLEHLRHFGFGPDDEVRLVSIARPATEVLESAVQARLSNKGLPHLMMGSDTDLVVLVRSDDAAPAVEQMLAALETLDPVRTTIGVSGPLQQEQAATGVVPAHRAAHAARLEGRRVGWFDTLTLELLLADETVRAHVSSLTRSTLEPLLTDPAAVGQDLVATLRTYLEHNGSWETAARALGVHRHTLRNRITRIEKLTGMRLETADNRVVLLLALATLESPQSLPGR